jgi:hypothetical protein
MSKNNPYYDHTHTTTMNSTSVSLKRKRADIFGDIKPLKAKSTQTLNITVQTEDNCEQLAKAIFNGDAENLVQVCGVENRILLHYRKSMTFTDTKGNALGTLCCAAGEPNVTVMNVGKKQSSIYSKDVTWDFDFSRTVTLEEPDARDGYVNIYSEGRWQQRDCVPFVIGHMIKSMRNNSKPRGTPFEMGSVLRKLLDAFGRCSTHCVCGHKICTVDLDLYGPHQISADRSDDSLGYGCEKQTLNIISKQHNLAVKHTAQSGQASRSSRMDL